MIHSGAQYSWCMCRRSRCPVAQRLAGCSSLSSTARPPRGWGEGMPCQYDCGPGMKQRRPEKPGEVRRRIAKDGFDTGTR